MELEKYNKWEDKLKAFLSRVSETTSSMGLSQASQAALCTAVYKRLIAIQNYDATKVTPLRTPIVLLKPTAPTLRNIAEDYGLKEVRIFFIEITYQKGPADVGSENNKF